MGNNFENSVITELKQRKLFNLKEFRVYEDRLFYKKKNLFNSFELEVPFEDLTNHVIYQKTSKPILWAFAAFFLIVLITKTYYMFVEPDFDFGIYFVVIVLFFLCYLGAFLGQHDVLLIKAVNPDFIEIYNKRPNENAVDEFHIKLRRASKDFLVNKYVYAICFPLEQRRKNLDALKDIRIIDDFDFKMISAKINTTSDGNPIGFKFS